VAFGLDLSDVLELSVPGMETETQKFDRIGEEFRWSGGEGGLRDGVYFLFVKIIGFDLARDLKAMLRKLGRN